MRLIPICSALALLVFIVPAPIFAANPDFLVLNDGKLLVGRPWPIGDSLRVELSNGVWQTVARSDVTTWIFGDEIFNDSPSNQVIYPRERKPPTFAFCLSFAQPGLGEFYIGTKEADGIGGFWFAVGFVSSLMVAFGDDSEIIKAGAGVNLIARLFSGVTAANHAGKWNSR